MENEHEQAVVDRASRACAATAQALRDAGVQPEALAEYVPESRRLLVLRRPATMRPLGEVWRLGSLLLGTDGRLYGAGRATRAAERGRVGYQSVSREERRDLAAAALRGGYPEGAAVNFDAVPLLSPTPERSSSSSPSAPSSSPPAPALPLPAGGASLGTLDPELPLGLHDGELRVRWRAGATLEGAATLEAYLRERAELLIHPPLSAS